MSSTSITKRKLEEALSVLDNITSGAVAAGGPKKKQATTAEVLSAKSPSSTPVDPLKQYRPWDRSDFMARLATYRESTWFDKPITPVDCARYGWVNFASERLRCGLCSAQLIFAYPDEAEGERREGLTAKYKVELSISHEQPCSWREHPCDASIYIFPNVGPASRSAKFEQTVQALTEIGDQLPVTTHPLTTDQLDIITIADPAIADSRICATASALALFGWVPHTVAARHALRCELCLRVVGLWSCRALKDEPFKESEGTDGVLDEQRNAFDVVMEHRGYCPWVEGGVEAEVSVEHVKPGWERTLEALVKRRGGEGGGDAGGKESVTQVEDVSAYIRGLLDGSIGATVRK